MKHPIIKRFIWIIIFAVLVYTAFIVWSGVAENVQTLRLFPWNQMPLILGAVVVNLLVREVKWDYFRRAAGVDAPRGGSFLVFMSGYSMAISPARAGELIKPFMYKEYFDRKMRRTIPLVFCERVSDLLGLIVLGGISAGAYLAGILERRQGESGLDARFYVGAINAFLVFSAVFMAALIGFIRKKEWVYGTLNWLARVRVLRRTARNVGKLYFRTYPLLTTRNLVITTAIAAFSWFFECVAILWIFHGVGATHITLLQATFIFCMATISGGFLFFLPGGIGGFEAVCALMLALIGAARHEAVSAIFITRFSTLFFAVAVGFLFILLTSWRYHKRMQWAEFEQVEEEGQSETIA